MSRLFNNNRITYESLRMSAALRKQLICDVANRGDHERTCQAIFLKTLAPSEISHNDFAIFIVFDVAKKNHSLTITTSAISILRANRVIRERSCFQ